MRWINKKLHLRKFATVTSYCFNKEQLNRFPLEIPPNKLKDSKWVTEMLLPGGYTIDCSSLSTAVDLSEKSAIPKRQKMESSRGWIECGRWARERTLIRKSAPSCARKFEGFLLTTPNDTICKIDPFRRVCVGKFCQHAINTKANQIIPGINIWWGYVWLLLRSFFVHFLSIELTVSCVVR